MSALVFNSKGPESNYMRWTQIETMDRYMRAFRRQYPSPEQLKDVELHVRLGPVKINKDKRYEGGAYTFEYSFGLERVERSLILKLALEESDTPRNVLIGRIGSYLDTPASTNLTLITDPDIIHRAMIKGIESYREGLLRMEREHEPQDERELMARRLQILKVACLGVHSHDNAAVPGVVSDLLVIPEDYNTVSSISTVAKIVSRIIQPVPGSEIETRTTALVHADCYEFVMDSHVMLQEIKNSEIYSLILGETAVVSLKPDGELPTLR